MTQGCDPNELSESQFIILFSPKTGRRSKTNVENLFAPENFKKFQQKIAIGERDNQLI